MPIGQPLTNENNRPIGAEFQLTDGGYDPTNGKQSPKKEITNENRGQKKWCKISLNFYWSAINQ